MIKIISQFLILKISLGLLLINLIPVICPAQESRVEDLLSQADVLYIQGNYEKARTLYLEIIKLTDRNIYLSRAFFGAALCSFNLGDEVATRSYLQKLFSVDPKKEISALFYPQPFLKIFQEVKDEGMRAEKKELPVKSTETEKAEKELKDVLSQKKEIVPSTTRETIPRSEIESPELELPKSRYLLGGHWEIEIHYGRWGLQPVLALFEKNLKKRIGSEVRRELTQYLSSRYGGLVESAYEQQLSLQVEGWNEGLGLRYFSRGEAASFSLGFSLERTHLRLKSSGSIRQDYGNASSAEIEAEAFIRADPVCSHISFRWDFSPLSRFSPYFIFGLGFGPLNGKMGYSYTGVYKFYGYQDSIQDSQEKTFKEWQEEEASHINFQKIILLQACLGFRVKLLGGLSFLAEAGIWDGFLVRGSLAFRL